MKNPFLEERPATVLNVDKNAKTYKGQSRGYLTSILYLFPYKSFGFNVCPNAEAAGCHEPCLNTAGRGKMDRVQSGRLRKTFLFHNERDWFMELLFQDIEALIRKADRENLTPCVRLNGTSDLDWENIRHKGFSPMEKFPSIQFYDYTKMPKLAKNNNYHLTFSYSGESAYQKSLKKALRLKMNISVVFSGGLPDTFLGREVIDGDVNDLRFLDPDNVIVGLKAKGRAIKYDQSKFIVRVAA